MTSTPVTREAVTQQAEAVGRCLTAVAKAFGVNTTGFDWPRETCPDCGGELPNGCGCK